MQKLLVLLVVVAAVYAAPEGNCNTAEDCAASECCVSLSRFFIASKRALFNLSKTKSDKKGVCRKYITEGASCHMRGFTSCGCAPGLQCNYYPEDAPVKQLQKRKIAFRPGDSFCEA